MQVLCQAVPLLIRLLLVGHIVGPLDVHRFYSILLASALLLVSIFWLGSIVSLILT